MLGNDGDSVLFGFFVFTDDSSGVHLGLFAGLVNGRTTMSFDVGDGGYEMPSSSLTDVPQAVAIVF